LPARRAGADTGKHIGAAHGGGEMGHRAGAGPLVSCDDADCEYGQDVILEGIARRRVAEQAPGP